MILTDSKGVHDKSKQVVVAPKGREKRVDIEFLAFRQGAETSEAVVQWVNGDAMLANSFTKGHEPEQLRTFLSNGARWRIVYDPKYMSARRRKAAGFSPLEVVPEEDSS